MSTPVAHPLVSAYLRDLEMLLHGVEPGERAEVLGGVREHLEAAAPPGASEEDVRVVLAEFGSPHYVADEAYAGRPGPSIAAPVRRRPSPWLAHVACFINGAGLVFLTLLTALGAFASGALKPHPAEWVFMAMAFAIPWFAIMVLTSMTEVWGSPDKFRSILLYPMTLVLLALVTWLVGLAQFDVLVHLAALLVLAGAVWTLVRLVRSTRAPERGHLLREQPR
ncbi:MAG: hypothetical protein ABIW49_12545 [Knoellia sp.]